MEEQTNSILQDYLDQMKQDIIALQSSLGLKASGKSANSLEVNVSEKRGQLIDKSGSFEFQEYGRGLTKSTTSGTPTLREEIYDWLQYKKYGISYANDEERVSLSYAISKSIHSKGTYTFRMNKQTGVLSKVITEQSINSLKQALGEQYKGLVGTDIIRLLK